MDPASLIGVCGVAVQLVELLGKSIKTLSDLQGRWKDVDLALLSLKTQLNTLRAALLAICQWVDRHGADENYLLRMELDGSLRCCRLLINKIDLFLNEVRASVRMGGRSSTLELRKKIKVVFGGSSLDNVLNMIDRQTASMNLLLTACHWLVDAVAKKCCINILTEIATTRCSRRHSWRSQPRKKHSRNQNRTLHLSMSIATTIPLNSGRLVYSALSPQSSLSSSNLTMSYSLRRSMASSTEQPSSPRFDVTIGPLPSIRVKLVGALLRRRAAEVCARRPSWSMATHERMCS